MINLNLNCCQYFYCNYFKEISWDTLIAFLALIIAIISIFIASRFQLLTFINGQLIDIAKTCNSYLQYDYQIHNEDKITAGRASGIVTALEDAEIIIKQYTKCNFLIYRLDRKSFKRVFFNHLHSSIKELLKGKISFKYDNENERNNKIREDQLTKACRFFKKEIEKAMKFGEQREKRLGFD